MSFIRFIIVGLVLLLSCDNGVENIYEKAYDREFIFCENYLYNKYIFPENLPDRGKYSSIDVLMSQGILNKDFFTRYFHDKDSVFTADYFKLATSTIHDDQGVGIRFDQTTGGTYVISDVIPGGSAASGNVEKESIILRINGRDPQTLPLDSMNRQLIGKNGDTLVMTVKKEDGDTVSYRLPYRTFYNRSLIHTPINDSIDLLKVSTFTNNSCVTGGTVEELKLIINDLTKNGALKKHLVLDLRNCTFSNVSQCVKFVQHLPYTNGVALYKYTEITDTGKVTKVARHLVEDPVLGYKKFYLLVNENSGGGAEFVTRMMDNAEIITRSFSDYAGRTTAGNGLVNTVIATPDSALISVATEEIEPQKSYHLTGLIADDGGNGDALKRSLQYITNGALSPKESSFITQYNIQYPLKEKEPLLQTYLYRH